MLSPLLEVSSPIPWISQRISCSFLENYWNLKSRSLNVRLNRSTPDSSITVNVHIPSSDPDIRLRHLFLYITHEYTSRINLKNQGPSQRSVVSERPFATCEDSLEVSGSAALNLWQHRPPSMHLKASSRKSIMREEKKISLMNWIWRCHIKIRYFWEQEDISARWLASSTRVLRHPQKLQLPEPTSWQPPILSRNHWDCNKFLTSPFYKKWLAVNSIARAEAPT